MGRREFKVQVDGQLVFNRFRQRLDAATVGLGLAYMPEGTVSPRLRAGSWPRFIVSFFSDSAHLDRSPTRCSRALPLGKDHTGLARHHHGTDRALGSREWLPSWSISYSTGHWDGKTLVVDTSRISGPFGSYGVPQSPAARLVERFTPSSDGSRLDSALEVTDPEMLTRPVEQKSAWVGVAARRELMPFNCVADYQK